MAQEVLQPNGKINRSQVHEILATEIEALYGEEITSSSELKVENSELELFVNRFRLRIVDQLTDQGQGNHGQKDLIDRDRVRKKGLFQAKG